MSKDTQRSPKVFYGWVMVAAMASIGATTMVRKWLTANGLTPDDDVELTYERSHAE